jgi:hypothetical protein
MRQSGGAILGVAVDVFQRYWQEFVDLKRDAYYTELYHDTTE